MQKVLTNYAAIVLAFGSSGALPQTNSSELNSIDVISNASSTATKQGVYIAPTAKSVREIEKNNTKSVDDIMRSVPGAFTNIDKTSGAVNVNIRGLSGFGRVNTMIDGVSQTFYAASSDNGSKAGGTSTYGSLVDPNFLKGIEIDRGGFSGKGGLNALMGSSNFKTVEASDIINEGKSFGLQLNGSVGNNAIGPNAGVITAYRHAVGQNGELSFLYGISTRHISEDYKVGGNVQPRVYHKTGRQGYNTVLRVVEGNKKGGGVEKKTIKVTVPYDIYEDQYGNSYDHDPSKLERDLKQTPLSHIAKIQYLDDLNKATLQYRDYSTELSGRKITQKTYQADYSLHPEGNNFLDFNILYARTIGKQHFDKAARFQSFKLFKELDLKNTSDTLDINNTFRMKLSEKANLKTTVGFNLLKNKYERNRNPFEINYISNSNNLLFDTSLFDGNYMVGGRLSNTVQPEGGQDFHSVYLDNSLDWGIFTLDVNLNYAKADHWGKVYLYKGLNGPSRRAWLKEKYSKDIFALSDNPSFGKNSYKGSFANPEYEKIISENLIYEFDETLDIAGGTEENEDGVMPDGVIDNNDFDDLKRRNSYPFAELGKLRKRLKKEGLPKDQIDQLVDKRWEEMKLDMAQDLFNTVSSDPKDWNYEEIQRGTNRYLNYHIGLAANISDWFTPFVNFSRTHRAPNVTEMYFSELSDSGVDSGLKPEIAKTMQAGFNTFKENVFTEGDYLGFKFLAYKTKIDNYIYNIKGNRFIGEDSYGKYGFDWYIYHKNSKVPVNIKGLEVELNYDSGAFFANLAYARQNTNQPLNFTDASPDVDSKDGRERYFQGYGLTKLTMLPKDYASIELGGRFFKRKLTIGGIAKYYGPSKISKAYDAVPMDCSGAPARPNVDGTGYIINHLCGFTKKTGTLKSQPVIVDLYATYQPHENLSVKLEVQNVFNKGYINPLDAGNDSANQFLFQSGAGDFAHVGDNYARGRTAILSIDYRY